jgi:oligoribonuclease (3'-5' exoribonuclease)
VQTFLSALHGAAGARSITLAGNSIGVYDLPLLRRWLPGIFDVVHYRTLDVSGVRSYLREVVGKTLPSYVDQRINGNLDSNHRAADDTLSCLRRLRALKAWELQGNVEPDAVKAGWLEGFHDADDTDPKLFRS